MTDNNNKKFNSKVNLVWYFLKGSKRFFIVSVLLSFGITFFELISPKIVQYTVDYLLVDSASESGSIPFYLKAILSSFGDSSYLKDHIYIMALLVAFFALLAAP